MTFQTAQNKKLVQNRESDGKPERKSGNLLNELFNQSWEVFIVKWDKETKTFIGKVACCALEPV